MTAISLQAPRLVAVLLLGAVTLAPLDTAAGPMPDGFADLVDQVVPAVVNVSARQQAPGSGAEGSPEFSFPQLPEGSPFKDFFDRFFRDRPSDRGVPRPPRDVQALGSGFIIDSDGTIVTNNHVVDDAVAMTVILNDGSEHEAKLIGRDEKTDLAVLKIDAGRPLPAVTFGDSDRVRVGDWVVAVGNPFGLGGTVTVGVISARNREIEAGPYDDFLQLDAAINRGNSGGPSFNTAGEVIGINTAIFSPTGGSVGIGFAIPSNLARSVIEQLRQHGTVARGWLGVQIQSVTPEIADSMGLGDRRGALVAAVTPDGPAQVAGVHQGDVILSFDGTRIADARDLARTVAMTTEGSRVNMKVWRGDREVTLEVTVGRLSEQAGLAATGRGMAPAGETGLDEVGLAVASLTAERRRHFAIDDGVSGVVVTSVRPGSAAARRGLRPGDVIMAVGQEPVETPDQVAEKVTHAAANKQRSVLFLIARGGGQRFVPVELEVS